MPIFWGIFAGLFVGGIAAIFFGPWPLIIVPLLGFIGGLIDVISYWGVPRRRKSRAFDYGEYCNEQAKRAQRR